MGRDMVFVSSEFPVTARTKRLLRAADLDEATAEGLELYNTMGCSDLRAAAGAVQEYNRHVLAAPYSTFARRAKDAVEEAARIKAAWNMQSRDDYEPIIIGFSLSRLRPPKAIRDKIKKAGKAAYKISRNPALPAVAAMIPGVGPGLAAGITTYQAAMYAYDKAKAGDAQGAINLVANQAAKGNPKAAAALVNIRKGAAIVKDIQKMQLPSDPTLKKLIADRAGVNVEAVAKAYGLPKTAITASAISKIAQGKMPDLVKTVAEASPAAKQLATLAPAAKELAKLSPAAKELAKLGPTGKELQELAKFSPAAKELARLTPAAKQLAKVSPTALTAPAAPTTSFPQAPTPTAPAAPTAPTAPPKRSVLAPMFRRGPAMPAVAPPPTPYSAPGDVCPCCHRQLGPMAPTSMPTYAAPAAAARPARSLFPI
jgi:hypothetical protein